MSAKNILRTIPDKEMRQAVKRASESSRVTLERRRRHVLLRVDGEIVSSVPGTPSDWRSVKNMKRALARKGIIV